MGEIRKVLVFDSHVNDESEIRNSVTITADKGVITDLGGMPFYEKKKCLEEYRVTLKSAFSTMWQSDFVNVLFDFELEDMTNGNPNEKQQKVTKLKLVSSISEEQEVELNKRIAEMDLLIEQYGGVSDMPPGLAARYRELEEIQEKFVARHW